MTARELESAVKALERKQGYAREAAGLAVACGVLAVATIALSITVALAFMTGALAAAVIALTNFVSRRELITRLALDPRAHTIAAVRDYGQRLVRPAEREKLAAWLYEVVREATVPGSYYLTDRVSLCAAQLELLASEFAASRLRVRPTSAAACRHLLTEAAESPLYNPNIPAEELTAAIDRIRRGITN